MNRKHYPIIAGFLIVLALLCALFLFYQCDNPAPAPVTPVPPTATHTPTQMPTITQAPSITPTETLSPTPTNLPPTETAIPTDTPTNTPEPTATPTLTISPSVTPINTITPGRPTTLPDTGGTGPSNAGIIISLAVAIVLFFWAFDAAQLADEKNNYPPA